MSNPGNASATMFLSFAMVDGETSGGSRGARREEKRVTSSAGSTSSSSSLPPRSRRSGLAGARLRVGVIRSQAAGPQASDCAPSLRERRRRATVATGFGADGAQPARTDEHQRGVRINIPGFMIVSASTEVHDVRKVPIMRGKA